MNKFAGSIFILAIIIISILAGTYVYKENKNTKNAKQAEEKIVKKNDLRLAVLNLDTFNPIYSKNRYVRFMSSLFYDGLIKLDENYMPKLLLAESIEKKQNLEYQIKLKDVKWNRMEEKLSSEDVSFTIEKIKEFGGVYGDNVKNINELKILDDKTFSIILSKPDPFFVYNLTFPILKKTDNKLFKDAKKYGVPHGIGKYFLSKVENNNLIFKLNPNYFEYKVETGQKEEPYIKEIIVKRFSSGESLYGDFKSGEIDALETEKNDLEGFLGNYGYVQSSKKGRDFTFLAFNCEKINSKEFRKAISYILDIPIILNELNKSIMDSSYILDYGSFAYSKEISFEKNLGQAKTLLEKAGFVQKEGKWMDGKNELALNILVNKGDANNIKSAEMIKRQMENFGIKMVISLKDKEDYKKDILDKKYNIAIMSVRNSFNPDISNFLGEKNYFNYINPNILELLKQIQDSNSINEGLDEMSKEIKVIYKKIEEIYMDEVPFIPLYRNKINFLISTGLNLEGNLNLNNIFQNIEKSYRK